LLAAVLAAGAVAPAVEATLLVEVELSLFCVAADLMS